MLLLGKTLETFQNGKFKATGVFVIDPPVDLMQLYRSSKKTVDRNYAQIAVDEAKFVMEYLEANIGTPKKRHSDYERFSPFTGKTDYIENVRYESTEVKIYTEPAVGWNRKYRKREFEDTNAFQLENMYETLIKNGVAVEYHETKNQGFRSNGKRNPHAWSILEEDTIVEWMVSGKD